MADTGSPGLSYAEDRDAFSEAAIEFVRREVTPGLPAWRSAGSTPREVYEKAAETGLLGPLIADEFGGLGLTDQRFCQLSTAALAEAGAFGLAWSIGLHAAVAAPVIRDHLEGSTRAEVLKSMATGENVVAVAGLAGGVEMSRDGALVGVSRGVAAATVADQFLVVATNPDGARVVALVPRAGVSVRASVRALGAADAAHADVVFDGAMDDGAQIASAGAADDLVSSAALLAGGLSIAAARFCLNLTTSYVNEREVFGRPVALFDNTRVVVGDAHADVLMASAFLSSILTVESPSPTRSAEAAAVARRGAALFGRCADVGLQLHGGYGYMTEYPISHAYAAARYITLVVDALPFLGDDLAAHAGLSRMSA
jgi:alkylation response protein AidB-like acyl-CoA dehydrogenase